MSESRDPLNERDERRASGRRAPLSLDVLVRHGIVISAVLATVMVARTRSAPIVDVGMEVAPPAASATVTPQSNAAFTRAATPASTPRVLATATPRASIANSTPARPVSTARVVASPTETRELPTALGDGSQSNSTAEPLATAAPATQTALPAAITQLPTATESPIPSCGLLLGFAEWGALLAPAVSGDCVEDQSFLANGDGVQRTTLGEFQWRKADNRTSFTNGERTWILSADGIAREYAASDCNDPSFARRAATDQASEMASEVVEGAILPSHRIVSYSASLLTAAPLVPGVSAETQLLATMREQARVFEDEDCGRAVQLALELVVSSAQPTPGADGLYRLQMPDARIAELANWTEQNGLLLVLSVQPGRSSLDAEIARLLPYLQRPHVHLAIDPEFVMGPNQVPGEAVGSLDATRINPLVRTLATLASERSLPPKLLILHRFSQKMVTNLDAVDLDPRVQVVVAMDGVGAPVSKISAYNAVVRDQAVRFAGLKVFLTQDPTQLTPGQVVKLDPRPDLVMFQ